MSLSLRKPTFEVRDVGFGVWGKRPKFLVLALVRFKHHQHRRTSPRLHDIDNRRRSRNSSDTHDNAVIANMRTYDDTFSGQKIYPGKGKLFVRADSKIFRFQNGKTESLFLQRKNPRRIAWTVLCRRQRRKGISEEQAKTRRRRQVKSQRAVVGASLDVIKERRSQRPEARAAARTQATSAAKEKRAAAQSVKKAEKAKGAAKSAVGQSTGRVVGKQAAKGAAPKVKATTR
ncbi:60S ribosomal protein L24 [Friedmanniomyces endolithicus]|uniref:60S ribosomal protein L24 n=1 Tax=Rachicladosporium monterosium TaxID=1507873 RepID=A0ABR0L928_9PEZI|nr:60S ribosomal protein L24 [Friedmanniomyces endolithicus]KAK5145359.1 60S ribosomal protein L24 [Rachicladosporium monterosium]